jgi:hypothetical protein
LIALTGAANAERRLKPYAAEYKVEISVLGGVLDTELRETEDGYIARHTVRATGLSRVVAGGAINDLSEFEIAGNGLRPTRFETEDTITRDKTRAAIRFDWQSGQATGEVNGEDFAAGIDKLMFDRLSIQYELMHDLLNDRAGDRYVLFEVDEFKDLVVRRIGERTLKVPAGKFTAIGIQHQATDSQRVTTLWCVEELGYLPVMIEQHRKGKLRMRATLRKYEPL